MSNLYVFFCEALIFVLGFFFGYFLTYGNAIDVGMIRASSGEWSCEFISYKDDSNEWECKKVVK